jgi:hypothetical protein
MAGGVVTITERRAAEVARRRAALPGLGARLAEYARAHGGRYLLFGSAARDALRHDSDIDLLLDFPIEAQSEAWRFAEAACWALDLDPDIQPMPREGSAFLAHIQPQIVVLG